MKIERSQNQPILLVKWYDYTKWVLDRVDGFPKNQRFVLGTRLADTVVLIVELLGEASYSGVVKKRELLELANRKLEVVRWLIRLVSDRNLISKKQFLYSIQSLEECGKMLGGGRESSKSFTS